MAVSTEEVERENLTDDCIDEIETLIRTDKNVKRLQHANLVIPKDLSDLFMGSGRAVRDVTAEIGEICCFSLGPEF